MFLAIPAGTWAPLLYAPTAPSAVSIEARFTLDEALTQLAGTRYPEKAGEAGWA